MNGSLKKSNQAAAAVWAVLGTLFLIAGAAMLLLRDRSEERRVGKECT